MNTSETKETPSAAADKTARSTGFRGHLNFGLGLFERMGDEELRKVFTHDNKKPPTVAEIRAELKRYRDAGYKFFPPCDNVDGTGACRGH